MKIYMLSLLFLASLVASGQADNVVSENLATDPASYFAEELKALSHDSMQGRGTLQPGIRKAEKHIIRALENMAVAPHPRYPGYTQVVPLLTVSGQGRAVILKGGDTLLSNENIVLLSGRNMSDGFPAVFAGNALEKDLEKMDVKGKLVIARIGDGENQSGGAWMGIGMEKADRLFEKGASGLIEIFEPGKMPWQMLSRFQRQNKMKLARPGYDFLHCWVNPADSSIIPSLIAGDLELGIRVTGMQSEVAPDNNIIAWIPGTDPDLQEEIIAFSAHYDHVGIGKPDATGDSIYNGARDNAVGVATLLGLARHYAANPPKRPLLFVFFTAEERGLLGSKFFIENSPVPLNHIRFNFNCDNGGYTDTDMISIIGSHRLEGLESVGDWLAGTGIRHYENEALARRLFFASDNIHFAQLGIPASSFSMGFTDMDQRIMKYYHQAGDHFENFDKGYMRTYWEGMSQVAFRLVDSDRLPFWKKEDAYHAKALELYGIGENGK